nr:MAG TPA: hypothetical protein [Herelleviridae sp.]
MWLVKLPFFSLYIVGKIKIKKNKKRLHFSIDK